MKKVSEFEITKTKNGYEVFVYWEKRYTFPSLRLAKKFQVAANNLLFTELFKINELFIEISPLVQRQVFVSYPSEKVVIIRNIEEILDMIKYCHLPTGQNKNVWIISKIEQCYKNLETLNNIIFNNAKKVSDTITVYRSKIIKERLITGLKDFMEFKFVKLEHLNKDCKVIKMVG